MSTLPLTATALSQATRQGDITASDVAKDCLARIASIDGKVSAICETFTQRITEQAAALDNRKQAGEEQGA